MRWRSAKTGSKWYKENVIESDKGYRIIRMRENCFTAWRPCPTTDNGFALLKDFPTGEAARQACAEHYAKQVK